MKLSSTDVVVIVAMIWLMFLGGCEQVFGTPTRPGIVGRGIAQLGQSLLTPQPATVNGRPAAQPGRVPPSPVNPAVRVVTMPNLPTATPPSDEAPLCQPGWVLVTEGDRRWCDPPARGPTTPTATSGRTVSWEGRVVPAESTECDPNEFYTCEEMVKLLEEVQAQAEAATTKFLDPASLPTLAPAEAATFARLCAEAEQKGVKPAFC